MPAEDSYRLLEWDSAFFGFCVARIDPDLRSEPLSRTLAALRARAARLAYWQPLEDGAVRALARAHGATVAGTQVRFERSIARGAAAEGRRDLAIERCTAVTPELEALAVAAGALSRYALDPAMPAGTMARMYAIWIRESFAGAMGDEVLAARDAAGAAGLVTLKFAGAQGRIGLLSVAQRCRGTGVGRFLLDAASARFAERGALRASVVTQGENQAGCRLYRACGFAPAAARLAVHFWL